MLAGDVKCKNKVGCVCTVLVAFLGCRDSNAWDSSFVATMSLSGCCLISAKGWSCLWDWHCFGQNYNLSRGHARAGGFQSQNGAGGFGGISQHKFVWWHLWDKYKLGWWAGHICGIDIILRQI